MRPAGVAGWLAVPAEATAARSAVRSPAAGAAGVLLLPFGALLLAGWACWWSSSIGSGQCCGTGTMWLAPSRRLGCEVWCSRATPRGGRLSGSDGARLPPAADCTTSRNEHMLAGRPAMPLAGLLREPLQAAPAGRRRAPPRAAGTVSSALLMERMLSQRLGSGLQLSVSAGRQGRRLQAAHGRWP